MFTRTVNYPDNNSTNYQNTTRIDKESGTLDISFQRLKQFKASNYIKPELITRLLIDHNNLSELPAVKASSSGNSTPLTNLTDLNCSYNRISYIPYYPK